MPHTPFNQAQQEQIIAALFRREENKFIIENHHVSDRQLRRITNNLKTHGTFHAPSTKKMGRPTCINKEVEEDLKQYVAAQPLALLVDMQKYVQEKYTIKCSRASLSRRIREMGYTRGIIRRGFRADDQHVPQLSEADVMRIMGDPSPDSEMANLPPNSKRARYAWLMDAEKPAKKAKKARKKPAAEPVEEPVEEPAEEPAEEEDESTVGPLDPALQNPIPEQVSREQPQNPSQPPLPNGYPPAPMYVSPYRQVTAG